MDRYLEASGMLKCVRAKELYTEHHQSSPDSVIGGKMPMEIRHFRSVCCRLVWNIQCNLLLLETCLPLPSFPLLPLLLLLGFMVDSPPRDCPES